MLIDWPTVTTQLLDERFARSTATAVLIRWIGLTRHRAPSRKQPAGKIRR